MIESVTECESAALAHDDPDIDHRIGMDGQARTVVAQVLGRERQPIIPLERLLESVRALGAGAGQVVEPMPRAAGAVDQVRGVADQALRARPVR